MVTSPRRSSYGLTGVGLLVGALGGWVLGLLRSPKSAPQGSRGSRA